MNENPYDRWLYGIVERMIRARMVAEENILREELYLRLEKALNGTYDVHDVTFISDTAVQVFLDFAKDLANVRQN